MMEIYPNPGSGIFNLKISGEQRDEKITDLEIFSSYGEKILSRNNFNFPEKEILLDLSPFPGGIYLIKAITPAGVIYKKIVKQ